MKRLVIIIVLIGCIVFPLSAQLICFEFPPDTFPTSPSPMSVTAADLNGDSFDDLVICHIDGEMFSIMLNDGEGGFPNVQTIPLSFNVLKILVVKINKEARNNVEDIKNLLVPVSNGTMIRLGDIADFVMIEGPAEISHSAGRRMLVTECNVRERDIESFVKELQGKINEKIKMPVGYQIRYGGEFENLQRASDRLAIVVPIALGLIFLLLFASVNSIKQAFIIFTGILFAIVGGVVALWLRDMPFSISAGVGFIALFGVAVLNGVVMLTYYNKLVAEGMSIREAVIKGSEIRLRPVITTALVASLGFIPMAISTSAGAEVQRPLATVVIGGLITSTLLTLVVLPTVYDWFVKEKVVE